jgi:hypothetical protein
MVLVLISASRWFGWQLQAMTCARLTSRNCSGWRKPAKTMKSWMSCRLARRVLALVRLANHQARGNVGQGLKLRGGQVRQQGSRGDGNRRGRHGMARSAEYRGFPLSAFWRR